jgi:hypothetical protein
MVIDEVELARIRIDQHTHTLAVVTQAAFAAAQHKKSVSPFRKLLERFLP